MKLPIMADNIYRTEQYSNHLLFEIIGYLHCPRSYYGFMHISYRGQSTNEFFWQPNFPILSNFTEALNLLTCPPIFGMQDLTNINSKKNL